MLLSIKMIIKLNTLDRQRPRVTGGLCCFYRVNVCCSLHADVSYCLRMREGDICMQATSVALQM